MKCIMPLKEIAGGKFPALILKIVVENDSEGITISTYPFNKIYACRTI